MTIGYTIDEASVRAAAAAVGLELASEHVPGVIFYSRMIAEFAAKVDGFALPADMDIAPVFTPCSPPTTAGRATRNAGPAAIA